MSALPPDLPLPPFGDNLGRFGNDPDGLARKWSQKPTKPWGDFHKSEPLLFASCTTLILGPILGLSAALACLFIPPIFCIPVIILAVIAVVVACGHVLSRLWFPADKPPGASPTSVPNDVPWEKSKEVLSKFLAEEVKSPEEGKTDEDANPTKAALKKHLEDPNEDGARMGVFLLKDPNATPEKIGQFFEVVTGLDESRRMKVLMAFAKVEVPGFDTGQYESMGAFAMTHADSGVRQGYLDLLNGLG
ncbi:MAG: hypothetical protein LBF26_00660, partial [Puniceicoccales bacterium]|nr:hypothetical protein [Puniceicoccales bacterium]